MLVGDKAVIDQVLEELGERVPDEDIYDVPDLAQSARKAVSLVREGKAHFLMKGKLDTSILLKAVVNKENGLGKGGVMSTSPPLRSPPTTSSSSPWTAAW